MKHPQLYYESKVIALLQGASTVIHQLEYHAYTIMGSLVIIMS